VRHPAPGKAVHPPGGRVPSDGEKYLAQHSIGGSVASVLLRARDVPTREWALLGPPEPRGGTRPIGGSLSRVTVDAVRSAYEALGDGDVEPLVSLIHPDMEWRGRRKLSRLWRLRRPPS
jgi:hypothetical protein